YPARPARTRHTRSLASARSCRHPAIHGRPLLTQVGADTAEALGVAGEQPAARAQLAHHAGDDLLLARRIEVDQHVAQEDHVEFADRAQRIVELHLREAHALAQRRVHRERAVRAAAAAPAEALQVVLRNAVDAVERIHAAARTHEHHAADVGAEYFPRRRRAEAVHQHHGDAVGLLATGAGCAPHPRRTSARQGFEHRTGKVLQMPGLAEEIGFVRGQQIQHALVLVGRTATANQLVVGTVAGQPGGAQAPAEPAADQMAPGFGQIDTGHAPHQFAELAKLGITDRYLAHSRLTAFMPAATAPATTG